MANKIGRNKAQCKAYKDSGRREQNKRNKQAKNQKRIERFAKRKEDGKTYTYSKEKAAQKIRTALSEYNTTTKDFEKIKDIVARDLFAPNRGSNQAKHTPYSKWKSIMRKLDNEVAMKKNLIKKKVEKSNKKSE